MFWDEMELNGAGMELKWSWNGAKMELKGAGMEWLVAEMELWLQIRQIKAEMELI